MGRSGREAVAIALSAIPELEEVGERVRCPVIETTNAKIKRHSSVLHLSLFSVLLGVRISSVTLLVTATVAGGLFGQEAEAVMSIGKEIPIHVKIRLVKNMNCKLTLQRLGQRNLCA
jgi:hypothetical protein